MYFLILITASKATVRAHLSLTVCFVQLPDLLCYRVIVLLLNKINDDERLCYGRGIA